MFRIATWCAKCLFLYLLVALLAYKFAWVYVLPVWSLATKLHWTTEIKPVFLLNHFLVIFAILGFLLGLVPFGRLGKAVTELVPGAAPLVEPDRVPAILWAWLPVTIAFLIRFFTWQSRNSSVFGSSNGAGRVERFFGELNAQKPYLLDAHWALDRFLFTGPMLFLMACAIAVLLRHKFFGSPGRVRPDATNELS
jgi:hypothetical protein